MPWIIIDSRKSDDSPKIILHFLKKVLPKLRNGRSLTTLSLRVKVYKILIPKGSPLQNHIDKFKIHLVAEKSASENTVDGYLSDLNQFSLFLKETGHACNVKGAVDLKQIDRLAVRSYMVHLHDRGFTGTTMSRKLSSLSSFFKFLCREGYLQNNVVKSIPAPKKENYLPSFLSVDDIFRLLELPDAGTFIGVRDRAMLEMFYSTGMRISELVTLQMNFIDLESQKVRVLGKGKKERWLPLGEKAIAALNTYLSWRESLIQKKKPDPLPSAAFLNTRGNGLTTRGVRKIVGKYLDQLVSGRHSPHSIRHSFATHLLIQEMLGHASLSTTQKYTHLTVDRLMETYDQAHPRAQHSSVNSRKP